MKSEERNMWETLQKNSGGIIAVIAILGGFAGIVKWTVSSEIKPINTRIVSINKNLESIDKRIFRLEDHLISKTK